MIVFGTGHRPDKLGCKNNYSKATFNRLVELATKALSIQTDLDKVISGFALGWDLALAQAAINLNIYLIAAIPFKGQDTVWTKEQKELYHKLLDQAGEVVVVCEGGYSPAKMQIRNEWMCDNGDRCLALWNGSRGGTGNCIKYVQSQNKPIQNFWKSWEKYK